jgi:hypothetical protein
MGCAQKSDNEYIKGLQFRPVWVIKRRQRLCALSNTDSKISLRHVNAIFGDFPICHARLHRFKPQITAGQPAGVDKTRMSSISIQNVQL